jgi:8-oxo-dGTP pyrophosphatase MutT (NUDIX family)
MGVTEDKKVPVVLVDRPAAGWSLELPYGGQEKGQTPEQAAHDEFNQETPWLAETLHYLGPTAPQTDRLLSLTREGDVKLAHMFLATGLTPAPQDLEPHEVVVPYLVDLDILAEVTLTGDPLPDIGLPMLDTASCLTVQRGAYLLKKL